MKGTCLFAFILCAYGSPVDLMAQAAPDVSPPPSALGRAVDGAREVEARNEQRGDDILQIVEVVEEPSGAPGASPTAVAQVVETPAPARVVPPELPAAPAPAVAPGEISLELPGATEETAVTREEDKIRIDFPDEDVRRVINDVADLYELNVVIPETLVGRVSLRLRNVTWRQVFDVMLEPLNYTYVEEGNIIKIKSRDELNAEPLVTNVFIIGFATAADLLPSIQPLIDSTLGGKIQVDRRSNALVITERPSRMGEIQAIIDKLDTPTQQVMIESKFVEVTDRDESNLGVDWTSLSGYNVGAGPFNRAYTDDDTRTQASDNGETLTRNMDSVTGTRVNRTETSTASTEYLKTLTRRDTAVLTADEFALVLRALESKNDIQLVSNPTVVTLNNTPAKINIGEQYPVPEYTYNEQLGRFQVTGFEFKDIGIILSVVPQINSLGFINLNIKPEISSRTGEIPFESSSIPIITTRTTESTVTIKSGYTLAIGGLIERNSEHVENKVPLLGDIPGLGRLFQSKSNTDTGRNLIIFITAKVLSAQGATYREVFSQRRLYEMGIRKDDLPGYEPPATEEELFTRLQETEEELQRLRSEASLREQLQALEKVTSKETQRVEKIEERRQERAPTDREVPRRFN